MLPGSVPWPEELPARWREGKILEHQLREQIAQRLNTEVSSGVARR